MFGSRMFNESYKSELFKSRLLFHFLHPATILLLGTFTMEQHVEHLYYPSMEFGLPTCACIISMHMTWMIIHEYASSKMITHERQVEQVVESYLMEHSFQKVMSIVRFRYVRKGIFVSISISISYTRAQHCLFMEWMNVWMNDWTTGWMNECIKEWRKEGMKEWMNK